MYMSKSLWLKSSIFYKQYKNGIMVIFNNSSLLRENSQDFKDFNTLMILPCNIYIMSKHSESYIVNHNALNSLGLCTMNDIYGPVATYFTKEADILLQHDQQVINSNKIHIFDETCLRNDDILIRASSVKMPWYYENGGIGGIFGFSVIGSYNFNYILELTKAINLNHIHHAIKRLILNKKNEFHQLSLRQIDCLKYLLKGYTYKMIANILKISPRTVETHIEHLNNSLKCQNKSELIEKAALLYDV